MTASLPLNQIAISSIDLQRSELWWRQGLGFLPSGCTRLFRGKALSGTAGLPNAAATARWLVGSDEWLQIELWQYESPLARLMPADYSPLHEGFSRCGVWIKAFDATVKRLSELGSPILTDIQGEKGQRRACVRDPDGIFVELFEADPLSLAESAYKANAAFRSVTITTRDLNKATTFAKQGLGLQPTDNIHTNEHETLWGLDGAHCERSCFRSGPMLLEYVQYTQPQVIPKPQDARLNDQGILNIAFGDNQGNEDVLVMREQAIRAGAYPSTTTLLGKTTGAVYMTDPQGFSYEFMGAKPGLAQRLTGFIPQESPKFNPPDNQQAITSRWLPVSADQVFDYFADADGIQHYPGLGEIKPLRNGFKVANGVGAERLVNNKIHEQVTVFDRERGLIHYRALSGCPLKHYMGEIHIAPHGNGCHVSWINRFRSPVPGLGWLFKWQLTSMFNRVLQTLSEQIPHNKDYTTGGDTHPQGETL
ncbi:hypothetical protein R50073_29190 [Maricurvus nonylphenolicus]|uniref:SRPBCC family protein n=1 Tax=Maricurvus nonylphenolicus TaxID=1008307 RepID=UPI0036F26F25